MFNSKPLEIVWTTRNRNICSFLAVVFCTFVIVSSIASSFAIRNSYAQVQQQLEPRQAPGAASSSTTTTTATPTNNADPISFKAPDTQTFTIHLEE